MNASCCFHFGFASNPSGLIQETRHCTLAMIVVAVQNGSLFLLP